MKYRQLITKTLEDHPPFRERHRRVRGFVTLLKQEYVGLRDINPEYLVNFIYDALTMDRVYRLVLFDNPHLRGKDYDDKIILSQKAQINLEYTPNYTQDVKKLQNLR